MSFEAPFAESHVALATTRISKEDGARQERTAKEILHRLRDQPGVILADEVGMGKTFVALGVAASVALARAEDGPVVVMVPPSLKQKWPGDFGVFAKFCLSDDARSLVRAEIAESGVQLLRLLDDPPERRKRIVFLTHGALHRALTDEWVKLALIQRALRKRYSLMHVKDALPKFAGRLLRCGWIDRRCPEIWERLLDNPPDRWLRIMQKSGLGDEIDDDPVPQYLVTAMEALDFSDLLQALANMPVRESKNVDDRLSEARRALSDALNDLWQRWLQATHFRSPLLIFDEAHHLKNPTQLSSLFVDKESEEDSETVARGALSGVFERMLFLTATPFQLGHHELVNVLRRFEGIDWQSSNAPPMGRAGFHAEIGKLSDTLDAAQAASLRLDTTWGRLRADHLKMVDHSSGDVATWWANVRQTPPPEGPIADVVRRFEQCKDAMKGAETLLRLWLVRHLKPRMLHSGIRGPEFPRRQILVGSAILNGLPAMDDRGLEVDGEALLPFLLAVRAQVALVTGQRKGGTTARAVFAEGLASSYEAYLETRRNTATTDDDEAPDPSTSDNPEIKWYLENLDRVLPAQGSEARGRHPKISATIDRAVKLWWEGEKSLVFCHYRATGRALRRHISRRLEGEIFARAADLLGVEAGQAADELERLGKQFFDKDGRLRRHAEERLAAIVAAYPAFHDEERARVSEIALRFLRTPSFLVRYFPLQSADPLAALDGALDGTGNSGGGLRQRIHEFCRFLAERCVQTERAEFLDALATLQTGTFRRDEVERDYADDDIRYLPNVRLASGEVTNERRRKLMLAFNAPFFPEILIASSVMAEGVDLHLDCRFVLHHDLCWNPSTLEQRTGRIDRIGSKSERAGKPIDVYLPFVTATQDEKMFRVVRDRERWFSVLMGEKYNLDEASTDRLAARVEFPAAAASELSFKLGCT